MDTTQTSVAQSFNWVNFVFLIFLTLERILAWFLHFRSSQCNIQLCGSCLKAGSKLEQDPPPTTSVTNDFENIVIHQVENSAEHVIESLASPSVPPPSPVSSSSSVEHEVIDKKPVIAEKRFPHLHLFHHNHSKTPSSKNLNKL